MKAFICSGDVLPESDENGCLEFTNLPQLETDYLFSLGSFSESGELRFQFEDEVRIIKISDRLFTSHRVGKGVEVQTIGQSSVRGDFEEVGTTLTRPGDCALNTQVANREEGVGDVERWMGTPRLSDDALDERWSKWLRERNINQNLSEIQ